MHVHTRVTNFCKYSCCAIANRGTSAREILCCSAFGTVNMEVVNNKMSPTKAKRKRKLLDAPKNMENTPDEPSKKKKKSAENSPKTPTKEVNNHEETQGDVTSPAPTTSHKHTYTAEEANALKRRKNLYQKKRMQQPKFFLMQGKQSIANGDHNSKPEPNGGSKLRVVKRREPVSITEVLYLLEFALFGNYASFQPSWCKLLRVAKVEKVVLIILNGLTSQIYRRKRHCFPNIASGSVSAKVIPASSYFAMLQDLLSHRKSNTRFDLHKHRIIQAKVAEKAELKSKAQNGLTPSKEIKEGGAGEDESPPPGKVHYIVSEEDRRQRGYPSADDENFVSTKHAEGVTDSSPLFGIDCEMVVTSAGVELARVSLTDEEGKLLYNSLVKPDNPVRDYVTKYSGITKKLLDPVETRLADVQKAVIDLLPPDAILVGQGLENDLRALKLHHPHCVDTSNMFTDGSARRVKLRLLAKEYLNRDIQCSAAGHDSVEDAKAALDLFKLKLAQGSKLRTYYREYNKGPVFEARESIFQTGQELQKKMCAIDTRFTLKKFKKEPVSCVVCSNDKEICKKACNALATSDLVVLQLHGYNNLTQGNTIKDADIESTLSLMDERVGTLLESLPPNSLYVTLMPGKVMMRDNPDSERGDYRTRNGRCVVGLTLEKIVYDEDR